EAGRDNATSMPGTNVLILIFFRLTGKPRRTTMVQLPRMVHHSESQPRDAFRQALFAGRKTPAQEAFAGGPEGRPGRQPEARVAHQPLAEFKTVGNAAH